MKALPSASAPVVGAAFSDPFKVHHDDDPDPEKAGQGLAAAPLMAELLGARDLRYWMMSPAEQMALVYLCERLRPAAAIEIGTRFGGSLQVLAKYSRKVYSLDLDAEVPRRLAGRHANVEFLTGPSQATLPPLLARLQQERAALSLVLVDGDHTAGGVAADLDAVLQFRPQTSPLFVLMHDSFNPECREGLRRARWADNPHVHVVELDFVPGTVNPSPRSRGELWGGIALAVLLPEPRAGRLRLCARGELTLKRAWRPDVADFARKLKRKLVGGRRRA